MSTYTKNGYVLSHFIEEECSKYDKKAKDAGKEFLSQMPNVVLVKEYDRSNNNKHTKPDLVVTTQSGQRHLFEVEIKKEFHYAVKDAAHVAQRKGDHLDDAPSIPVTLLMFDNDCVNVLLIPYKALSEAQSVKGWDGRFGSMRGGDYSGAGPHGCTRIYKYNKRDKEETHFLEIPYKWCRHFQKIDGIWVLVKESGADKHGGQVEKW